MNKSPPQGEQAAVLLALRPSASGCTLQLRVMPRARKLGLLGVHDGRLKLGVSAAPEQGKANEQVREFLAHKLACPRSRINIVSGQTSRDKLVALDGFSCAEAGERLGACGKR